MLMLLLCILHIVSLQGDHGLRRATAKRYRENDVELLSSQVPARNYKNIKELWKSFLA